MNEANFWQSVFIATIRNESTSELGEHGLTMFAKKAARVADKAVLQLRERIKETETSSRNMYMPTSIQLNIKDEPYDGL